MGGCSRPRAHDLCMPQGSGPCSNPAQAAAPGRTSGSKLSTLRHPDARAGGLRGATTGGTFRGRQALFCAPCASGAPPGGLQHGVPAYLHAPQQVHRVSTPTDHLPQIGLDGIDDAHVGRSPAMQITQAAFARHNTFHPRFGWLKKGFDAASADAGVFAREDAPIVLGVGKNMVRAIRYWCLATRVLADAKDGSGVAATPFGLQLLGPDGLDPFTEDLGSLWLLHWRLVGNAGLASAWWFTFFRFARSEFSADELSEELQNFVTREFPGSRYAPSSFRKDASCVTRMYGELPGSTVSEESIQCPFAELRLLRPAGRRTFAFQVGAKPGLSWEIVAAASLEFAATLREGARTVTLGSLLRQPGSPGLAFRLGESALFAALEEAVTHTPDLALTDAGGLVQLSYAGDPWEMADQLIRRHFAHSFTGAL